MLAYLRKGETFANLAAGFGVGAATAWRYVNETVALLAARAPKLRRALRDAAKAGYAYVILDGTLIPIDRVAADRPFYSGKHRRHGMNLQVIPSPDGAIICISGALPGSVHDTKAAWIWGVLDELEAAGLLTLADKGYQGTPHARTPCKGRSKPESQKLANRAHAKLRSPGSARTPSSRPGASSASSAAAPGAPDNSPRPSTYCRSVRQTQDEKCFNDHRICRAPGDGPRGPQRGGVASVSRGNVDLIILHRPLHRAGHLLASKLSPRIER